ncbi:MAG: inorganic phosphate transporter [Planctomycetota bacterium]|nr:inorganic phosphate transporter [Planctomycetota bacterium]MDA1210925.1 inorganic phosphate transporter [Planctomycetota bacterium]
MTVVLLLAVCFLAYSNGANDNFKGVASLFGSRTTSYRAAIAWATVTTFAGSVAAIFLAQTLLKRFSGKGLVPDELVGSENFLLSVALGAGFTVILATYTGFPISTTHALTGAMVGSGWVAVGSNVHFVVLGKAFFLPLLVSPLVAIVLGAGLYLIFRWFRLQCVITKEWCICVGKTQNVVPIPQPSSLMALQTVAPVIEARIDVQTQCDQRYAGYFLGVNCQQMMDLFHFLSAGIVSFARGLNDTPKIAALLLVLPGLGVQGVLLAIAVAIAIGGLLSARRVAETMSHKITGMNHGQGFSANLATGLLVTVASLFGMPVSTTHVSVGSLLGIGITTRQADFRVIRYVLLSWLLTLPCAAILGGGFFWLTSH